MSCLAVLGLIMLAAFGIGLAILGLALIGAGSMLGGSV